jgi:DNA-binding winged helix-turn-helix (wHTH) protein/TolB-like protein
LRLRPFRELTRDARLVPLARKPLELLSVLAEAGGTLVTKDELMSAVWPNAIVEENALQAHVATVRKALGEDSGLLVTVHGLGYRLAATPNATLAEQSPTAATPAQSLSDMRTADVRPSGRRTVAVVAGTFSVAAALVLLLVVGRTAKGSQPIAYPSVAVGAFQPASSGSDAKSFAASLTNDVADDLSHFDLTVVRTSSPLAAAQSIFSPARPDFVLDGRLGEKAGRVTVTTELVDAHNGVVVYAFDTPQSTNASASLAAEIASHVALSLDPTKLTNDMAGKLTAADYTLIARANEAIDRWDMPTALAENRALAERHPEDGDLQASLGITSMFAARDSPPAERSELMRLGKTALARAAALTRDSALLEIGRSMLVGGPASYADQERLTRKALSLDPNQHVAYNGLGELMMQVGRTAEGVRLIRRSVQLGPSSRLVVTAAAKDYATVGDAADAQEALARLEAAWPDAPYLPALQYLNTIFLEDSRGIPQLDRRYAGGDLSGGIPLAHRNEGVQAILTRNPALVRRLAANCLADYGKSNTLTDSYCLFDLVRVGDLDGAFRLAERAFPDYRRLYPESADEWLTKPPPGLDTMLLFSPRMQAFRHDVRFWGVALRTGLVDYWRSTGSWPDFCQPQVVACQRLAAAAKAKDDAKPRAG